MRTQSQKLSCRMVRIFCFMLAALGGSGSVRAEMRIWEEKSGLQIQAEFVREIFGEVELRRPDGSLYSIPWEKLSEEDAQYVRTVIPPEVQLTVRKSEKDKERNHKFVRAGDSMTTITVDVTVRKKSRDPYRGVLRAEVYIVGQEVATDDYRLLGKSTEKVLFTDENRGTVSFAVSADSHVYEEYNEIETRGAEYAGYLVVIVDSAGNKLAVEKNLSWLQDDDVDKLRRFYVGAFFDETCRKRSVPRPKYYEDRYEF